jgi:hypothetical protein
VIMNDDRHLLIGRAHGLLFRRENITESYVSIPPADLFTDSDGAMWTAGFRTNSYGEFNALRNDIDTGEFGVIMEYLRGQVRIYGKAGWRTFSRSRRHFI